MSKHLRKGYKLLHDGLLALAVVERNGIKVDTDYLDRKIEEVGSQIAGLEGELQRDKKVYRPWRKRYGDKLNLDSTAQLATVLYDDLGFKVRAYTEKGQRKTDEEALKDATRKSDVSDFTKLYLRRKKLLKVRTTYLIGIRREVQDGFLHPSYNLNRTVTYRSSSSDPNSQNFPVRDPELGDLIRGAFVSRYKNGRLCDRDYSALEVKIAYTYHKDPAMRKYLTDPTTDMHRDTAAECYMLKPEEVNKTSRYCAKNMFVFPQFYGSFYVDCARAMWKAIDKMSLTVGKSDVSLKDHLARKGIHKLGKCDPEYDPVPGTFEYHIREVERRFWNKRFPVYAQWKKDWYNSYLEKGYFLTHTGFKIGGDFRRNQVINYPVQGSAFHCLLMSIVLVNKELAKYKMKSKLCVQIHDSMTGDVPDDEVQDFLDITHDVMTKKVPEMWDWINIPLDAEAEVTPVGGSWADKKVWEKNDSGLWVPAA